MDPIEWAHPDCDCDICMPPCYVRNCYDFDVTKYELKFKEFILEIMLCESHMETFSSDIL